MRFVLDASAALNLCFRESDDMAGFLFDVLADGTAVVPSLWNLEVNNAFLTAERRGRISRAEIEHPWTLLASLPIEESEGAGRSDMGALRALAAECRLSAYDAEYLYLALREGLPLVTADTGLQRAGRLKGVETLP